MNTIKCNICESLTIDSYLKKDIWEIVRCKNCGFVFVKNIPSDEDLKNIYTDIFFKDGQKSPIGGLDFDNNPTYLNARKRLEVINKMGHEKGRLLDIGCATGIFLKTASSFYDCTGLDISRYAIEFAVNNYGVNAVCGTIFDVDFGSQLFDMITMWDVIEHVRDPNKYVEKVSRLIQPNGLLVLSTGNVESLMFKLQKKNWHLLIPPLHLFYFSPKTIRKLLECHGFRIINISHQGQYTNVGYIFAKLKRLHSKNKLISLADTIIESLRLNRLNIYLNLFDVMTVYAVYSPDILMY